MKKKPNGILGKTYLQEILSESDLIKFIILLNSKIGKFLPQMPFSWLGIQNKEEKLRNPTISVA
jgi:hypothetical protein